MPRARFIITPPTTGTHRPGIGTSIESAPPLIGMESSQRVHVVASWGAESITSRHEQSSFLSLDQRQKTTLSWVRRSRARVIPCSDHPVGARVLQVTSVLDARRALTAMLTRQHEKRLK